MITSYPTAAAATATITTVDCEKQVRSWRLLRSLVELLIPSCNCTFVEPTEPVSSKKPISSLNYHRPSFTSNTTNITGTIFGYRKGKVNFCIQTNPNSSTPLLLLELAVSTSTLAREMRGGLLRIALESSNNYNSGGSGNGNENSNSNSSLLSTPVWTMYCNGKKVGFAMKKKPTKSDLQVLNQMYSVVVGAGTIHGKEINRDDDIMYLRGKFERIHGSSNSESFHLIDPEGSMGQQQLSIFFLRSRST